MIPECETDGHVPGNRVPEFACVLEDTADLEDLAEHVDPACVRSGYLRAAGRTGSAAGSSGGRPRTAGTGTRSSGRSCLSVRPSPAVLANCFPVFGIFVVDQMKLLFSFEIQIINLL